ncbi:MAG: M48 family metalloprotease [Myxococcota bacterium]
MSHRSRPRGLRPSGPRAAAGVCRAFVLAGLVALLPLAGCLTLLGGEQKVGDQAAAQIERETGVVRSAPLDAYVRAIGERLAAGSKRPGPWRFVILDDPVPNAFALPGGHVYVTRGLLALANSEDELAGVIGHEIGHVLEGHGGKRVNLNAPFAILTGITRFATGIVSPRLGQAVADGGNALSQGLVVAPYSRQQERAADRIGQELAAAAGWDPSALSHFLDTLGRATVLMQGDQRRPGWLDTHPATPERVATTAERAAQLRAADRPPIARDRRDLLQRLDGLIVGRDAAHGVRVGGRFVRPEWRVSIGPPEGWSVGGNADIAAAGAPSGDAMVALGSEGPGDDPRRAVRALEAKTGETIEVEEIQVGGRPALRHRGSERVRGGRLSFESTWVALAGRVFRLVAVCDERRADAWRGTFQSVATSLRAASASELAQVKDERLRSVEARAGEDAARLAERSGSAWTGEQIEVANGLATGAALEPGRLVKITRREPYTPRTTP